MRKMKGSSSYLRNQVRKNIAKASLCLIVFVLIFAISSLQMLLALHMSLLAEIGLATSLVPLAGFFYYQRKYHIYNGGWQGEKQVIKLLEKQLSDDYILLNDLYLRNGGGDIDHIVLSPNGIFVLETKNWSGVVSCQGDEWSRAGRNGFKGSPSRQVKRNVLLVKRIIDSSSSLRQLNATVEGIVVFTNNHTTLHINNPPVTILKLAQLPSHILAQRNTRQLSREKLEDIVKEILMQKA